MSSAVVEIHGSPDARTISLVCFTIGESLWTPSGVAWPLWLGHWAGGVSCCVAAAACRSLVELVLLVDRCWGFLSVAWFEVLSTVDSRDPEPLREATSRPRSVLALYIVLG